MKPALAKNDGRDIGLAVRSIGKSHTWEEFQSWIEYLIETVDLDDLPSYIFDLLTCKTPAEMWQLGPKGIFGFMPSTGLSYEGRAALWGIGYARKQEGLPVIRNDLDGYFVSEEEAASALACHPEIAEWFERFFRAIGKPDEFSR